MERPSIVFFGSGPVAAASLELLAQEFEIEAVVTKPRLPHHHGPVPVLELAKKLDLPVVTAGTRKELTSKVLSARFESRVAVLIDFGIIVEQAVIDAFPLGIVNSHFSLLPQWRGADPITFAILSGQDRTGVSLMLLVKAMDEGPILAVGEFLLPPDITTPELTDGLIQLSHALLVNTLPRYLEGDLKAASQDKVAEAVGYSAEPTYSRKLTKEDGILNWDKPADVLEREIRAFIDWPKSRAILGGHAVIITKAHALSGKPAGAKPGELFIDKTAKTLVVTAAEGTSLAIDRLKPAGKGEMTAAAFLNGYAKDL